MTGDGHPTLEESLTGVMRTIEEILLPELRTSWAKACAIQAIGLLRYALAREAEPVDARQQAELAEVLAGLTDAFPALIAGGTALDQASALLVRAQGVEDAASVAIRERLRPVVMRHAAEDLAATGPLLQSFQLGSRGLSSDAE